MHRLRKIVVRIGCRRNVDVACPQQLVGGPSSSHGAVPTTSQGAGPSSHGGIGQDDDYDEGDHQGQDDDDDEGEHQGQDDDDEAVDYDEIGMSQQHDSPQGTQGSTRGGRPHRMS